MILLVSVKRFNKKNPGFTLIELLVVIAIIGLLSSVVLASLSGARESARDARRRSDLNQIRIALNLYYNHNGNYVEDGSGCGFEGNGNGSFAFQGSSYPKSISQCLVEDGSLSSDIVDPSGKRGVNGGEINRSYMKYTCDKGTFLFASLEGEPNGDVLPSSVCQTNVDTLYGMNYYLRVD